MVVSRQVEIPELSLAAFGIIHQLVTTPRMLHEALSCCQCTLIILLICKSGFFRIFLEAEHPRLQDDRLLSTLHEYA